MKTSTKATSPAVAKSSKKPRAAKSSVEPVLTAEEQVQLEGLKALALKYADEITAAESKEVALATEIIVDLLLRRPNLIETAIAFAKKNPRNPKGVRFAVGTVVRDEVKSLRLDVAMVGRKSVDAAISGEVSQ
jgi:hypothetical protein